MFISSPELSHTKNARSEGNVTYIARSPSPPLVYAPKLTTYGIHRSESSPTVSPLRFKPPCERSPSPEVYFFRPEDDRLLSRDTRGRRQIEDRFRDDQPDVEGSPRLQSSTSSTRPSPLRPSRMPYQEPFHYACSRNLRSPTKTLDSVYEKDEFDASQSKASLSPPPVPPKKRSRSPMKKMFGEHGWLGQSPNEKPEPKFQSKRLFAQSNGDFQGRKKTTMIGKLKSKLEEIVGTPNPMLTYNG
jgi:hypothetical protein